MKSVAKIQAAVAVVVCANFLLGPIMWSRFFGATADPMGMLLFQLIGFLFAALALVRWTDYTTKTLALGRALRFALTAAIGVAAGVASLGAMYGVYKQFAWGPVAMLSMLGLGLVFVRPSAESAMARAAARTPVDSYLQTATSRSSSNR